MQKENIPVHIGIIPDGNRRWAKAKGLIPSYGHEKSAEIKNILSLFEEARKLKIKFISIWGFSTENWKREKREVDKLFEIFFRLVDELEEYLHKHKIRFRHFGRKDRLPTKLIEKMKDIEKKTEKYSDFNVNLLLDYGGRDEIVRVVNKILKSGRTEIDETSFSEFLDSKNIPDLDLIIRTSGEKRLSGFMPFQGVYAELYFIKKHFPDFSPKDLRRVVLDFSKRKRTFGGN